MFRKVLVANRGEIAVRVIRACRDLGVGAAAVYSEVDRGALHVRLADEAVLIGPGPSSESYLHIGRILEAAREVGADAVHPGYGFLSENAEFAREVGAAGLVFIGPSPESIALMGSKLASRAAAADIGVPVIPGSSGAVRSAEDARKISDEVGFPLMLKASAGGGGKGMRRVDAPAGLKTALKETSREALAAFGDDAVYIERVVERPRHIEIQVVADRFGRAIHLGERECTIQRRHQKVIEEAPSPVVDAGLREAMGEAALRVARAANYDSIGTVEFLLDGKTREFYFLEMNTRVQVEHPVTEAVTGVDLVTEQIRIAAGQDLEISQDQVRILGAALECRIYAEDPANGFVPSPGRIRWLEAPSGPGIREDTGVYSGWRIPLEYDPLLSKLIAWAPTRETAHARMRRALGEYRLDGIAHNIGFFRELLDHPDFVSGDIDTGFIDRWLSERPSAAGSDPEREENERIAILAAALFESRGEAHISSHAGSADTWKLEGRRRLLRGH